MQNKLIGAKKLLDGNGKLAECGYSTKLVMEYDRKDIRASKLRIKEWDYYFIGNKEFGLSLTIADNAYMGIASAQFFDYTTGTKVTNFAFVPFPMGRMRLPTTSERGDARYQSKKITLDFINGGNYRRLYCNMPKFDGDKQLIIDVNLTELPEDSMVIATPFAEDKRAFYYNQKINCMKVTGNMRYGEKDYNLNNMLAVLDWGRGVWTYDNTWYWSSMSARLKDGSTLGFNLGYGFGDTSAASENMLFYKGRAHKLELVDFGIPVIDGRLEYMKPWHFTSSNDRLNMIFRPIYDNRTKLNALIIAQDAHQVFGTFEGRAVLDDGSVVDFCDCFGFAERVRNKW